MTEVVALISVTCIHFCNQGWSATITTSASFGSSTVRIDDWCLANKVFRQFNSYQATVRYHITDTVTNMEEFIKLIQFKYHNLVGLCTVLEAWQAFIEGQEQIEKKCCS